MLIFTTTSQNPQSGLTATKETEILEQEGAEVAEDAIVSAVL
jgi:hypothetical protein